MTEWTKSSRKLRNKIKILEVTGEPYAGKLARTVRWKGDDSLNALALDPTM